MTGWSSSYGPSSDAARRENGSGTDHGAAGLAFLIGRRVIGKMVGEFPGLAKLDENENLVNTSDFRAMYAGLLGQWFQTEAGLVIPEAGTGLRGRARTGIVRAADRVMERILRHAPAASACALACSPWRQRSRSPSRLPPGRPQASRGFATAHTPLPDAPRCVTHTAARDVRRPSIGHRDGASPRRRTVPVDPRAGQHARRHGDGRRRALRASRRSSDPSPLPKRKARPPRYPRVQVIAVEYHFTLSRASVPAGEVALPVRQPRRGRTQPQPAVDRGNQLAAGSTTRPPGGSAGLQVDLKPGSYTLFCSLPEHEQKGMKATLVVE